MIRLKFVLYFALLVLLLASFVSVVEDHKQRIRALKDQLHQAQTIIEKKNADLREIENALDSCTINLDEVLRERLY